MNFVNPLGRSANDGPTPRACMCPVEGGFAAARNDNDNCIHCGYCKNCNTRCIDCYGCNDCNACKKCENCNQCNNCNVCYNCDECNNCFECKNCYLYNNGSYTDSNDYIPTLEKNVHNYIPS